MLDKFKYSELEQKELLKSMIIVVDSREKINSHVTDYYDKHNIPYIKQTLSFGDYSFMIPKNDELSIPRDISYSGDIIVERKASAEELSSNFSQTRTRFEEEFATAKAKRKYLLIENCNYSDIVDGKYKTNYNSKSYLGSLHSFNDKYDLQIVFMPDNKYTPIFIYGVFQYYFRNIIK
jgi:ERCC4-type nuclease